MTRSYIRRNPSKHLYSAVETALKTKFRLHSLQSEIDLPSLKEEKTRGWFMRTFGYDVVHFKGATHDDMATALTIAINEARLIREGISLVPPAKPKRPDRRTSPYRWAG